MHPLLLPGGVAVSAKGLMMRIAEGGPVGPVVRRVAVHRLLPCGRLYSVARRRCKEGALHLVLVHGPEGEPPVL